MSLFPTITENVTKATKAFFEEIKEWVATNYATQTSLEGAETFAIPDIIVYGDSIAAGTQLLLTGLGKTTNRQTGILARVTGATELNSAEAGTILLGDELTKQGSSKSTLKGSGVAFLQKYTLVRPRGPYMAELPFINLNWSKNDIGAFGPVNEQFLKHWRDVLFTLVCRARVGHVQEDNNASGPMPPTFTGTWAEQAETKTNSGAGYHYTTEVGALVKMTVPADYDGQAVTLQFLGNGTSTYWLEVEILVNGKSVGTFTNKERFASGNTAVTPYGVRIAPADVRTGAGITEIATGLAASATIEAKVKALSGRAIFDCAYIEATPSPLVMVSDSLRCPSYALYPDGGWPYTPTDADVEAQNAGSQAVCNLFVDGRVIKDGADPVVNKGGTWLNSVHPYERTCARIAQLMYERLRSRFGSEYNPFTNIQ